MQIKDKHVLIIGGAGLDGSHIAYLLVAKGAGRIVTNWWRRQFSVTAQGY
jgi:NAD(P)-dependent dehydrogenase (short-subunit alcohol dehydrogenase family)